MILFQALKAWFMGDTGATVLLVLSLLIFAAGCEIYGSGPEAEPEYQTKILDVVVSPNPVAVDDTIVVTCIIRDSLDDRFQFIWLLHTAPAVVTQVNHVLWEADVPPGTYSMGVTVENGDPDKLSVNRPFEVQVVSN